MRVRGSSGPSLWLRLIAANFDLHVYQNVRQIYWVHFGGKCALRLPALHIA